MYISPFQNGASRIKYDGYPDKHTSQWRLWRSIPHACRAQEFACTKLEILSKHPDLEICTTG
jgi:hypothetical protein